MKKEQNAPDRNSEGKDSNGSKLKPRQHSNRSRKRDDQQLHVNFDFLPQTVVKNRRIKAADTQLGRHKIKNSRQHNKKGIMMPAPHASYMTTKKRAMSKQVSDETSDDQEEVEADKSSVFRPIFDRMPSVVGEAVDNMDSETRKNLRREIGLTSMSQLSVITANEMKKQVPVVQSGTAEENKSTDVMIRDAVGNTTDDTTIIIDVPLMTVISTDTLADESLKDVVEEIKIIEVQDSANTTRIDEKRQRLLKTMQTFIEAKLNGSGSSMASQISRAVSHESIQLTIDHVAEILQKPANERTKQEYEDVHGYMTDKIAFFKPRPVKTDGKKRAKASQLRLTRDDKMKMYKVMLYKVFERGEILCQYGETGDRFFIILEGMVGVRVPMNVERNENCTWDIYKFVLKEFKNIRQFKDNASKECAMIVKTFGCSLLIRLDFQHVTDFVSFLVKSETKDESLLKQYPELNEIRLSHDSKRIKIFRERLVAEYDRIDEKPNGSFSKDMHAKHAIKIKVQLMEHVNQLDSGLSFGEASLIADAPRNATCYAMTERVITAILTKADYKKVLFERDRQALELKVGKIKQFDLFRNVTKRRLNNIYRLFYHQKTGEPYTAHRNQYLYRQGQPVDGIYCILEGNVKRIKESYDKAEPSQTNASQNQTETDSIQIIQQQHPQQAKQGSQTMQELRKNKAKQLVLTLIQKGETIGIEEIVAKFSTRQYSMQVASEHCVYLYLSAKQFRDKFFNQSNLLKHTVCEKVEVQDKFIEDLEMRKSAFKLINARTSLPLQQKQADKTFEKATKDALTPTDRVVKFSPGRGHTIITIESGFKTERARVNPDIGLSIKTPVKQKRQAEEQAKATCVPIEKSTTAYMTSTFKKRKSIVEAKVGKLDALIDEEIDKTDVNMQVLINRFRERRQTIEQVTRIKEQNRDKGAEMSSSSNIGRANEQTICKKFSALDSSDKSQRIKQLNMNSMTNKLVKDTEGIYNMWRNERHKEQKSEKMLKSLTRDKRIQRELRSFNDKLPDFVEFLNEQSSEYLHKLNIPVFEGSLLMGPKNSKQQQQANNNRVISPKASTIRIEAEQEQSKLSSINESRTPANAELPSLTCIDVKDYVHMMSERSQSPIRQHTRLISPMSEVHSHKPLSSKLMKVFYEWKQYHAMIGEQNKRKGQRHGEHELAERRLETLKLVTTLVDKSPFANMEYMLPVATTPQGRGLMRHSKTHFLPSNAQSVLSQRPNSRGFIQKAQSIPPMSPIGLSDHLKNAQKTATQPKVRFATEKIQEHENQDFNQDFEKHKAQQKLVSDEDVQPHQIPALQTLEQDNFQTKYLIESAKISHEKHLLNLVQQQYLDTELLENSKSVASEIISPVTAVHIVPKFTPLHSQFKNQQPDKKYIDVKSSCQLQKQSSEDASVMNLQLSGYDTKLGFLCPINLARPVSQQKIHPKNTLSQRRGIKSKQLGVAAIKSVNFNSQIMDNKASFAGLQQSSMPSNNLFSSVNMRSSSMVEQAPQPQSQRTQWVSPLEIRKAGQLKSNRRLRNVKHLQRGLFAVKSVELMQESNRMITEVGRDQTGHSKQIITSANKNEPNDLQFNSHRELKGSNSVGHQIFAKFDHAKNIEGRNKLFMDKVINSSGSVLRPTNKVLAKQQQYQAQGKDRSRRKSAQIHLEKQKSEAKITTAMPRQSIDSVIVTNSLETLHLQVKRHSQDSKQGEIYGGLTNKRKTVSRAGQHQMISLEGLTMTTQDDEVIKPLLQQSKNMLNPISTRNFQAVHQKRTLVRQKAAQDKNTGGLPKYTDRMRQELQKKAYVTLACGQAALEKRPALIGSINGSSARMKAIQSMQALRRNQSDKLGGHHEFTRDSHLGRPLSSFLLTGDDHEQHN